MGPWGIHLYTPCVCFVLAGKKTKLWSWPLGWVLLSIWVPLIFTAILLERYAFADKLRLRGSAKLGLKTSKCQLGFELSLCDWKTRSSPLGDLAVEAWGRRAHCGPSAHQPPEGFGAMAQSGEGREVAPGGGTLPSLLVPRSLLAVRYQSPHEYHYFRPDQSFLVSQLNSGSRRLCSLHLFLHF